MEHLCFSSFWRKGLQPEPVNNILKQKREINTLFPLENKLRKHLASARCIWLNEELSALSEVIQSWHN